MDIYFKKRRWKRLIFLVAILIGVASIFYTNNLVRKLKAEERTKVVTWVNALKTLISEPGDSLKLEISSIQPSLQKLSPDTLKYFVFTPNELKYQNDVIQFLSDILTYNVTIPIIIVDSDGTINNSRNLSKHAEKNIERELEIMKSQNEPIEILLSATEKQYVYYRESSILIALRYYPIVQFFVIIIFILVSYFAFSSSRKAEQNLVWVGMAKETAHQLGTPISSVIAWVELLKDENVNPEIIHELTKDTDRLEKIVERFSKVGSVPELYPENIINVVQNSVDYLGKRISKKIELQFIKPKFTEIFIPVSASLFSWVIENMVKNSVDAMEGKSGKITIELEEKNSEIFIDITDDGKGIPKSKQKTIFNPGFTTKKRGWGLGLSLSKRIIEMYHNGKLTLKNSEQGQGTTFRISLKK